jgi:predicted nucleotidyltransferase
MMAPGKDFNAWELSNLTNENYSAIWKELVHLERIGILSSKQRGRLKIYQPNPACPILPELKSMVLKTEGVAKVIHEHFAAVDFIKSAFIYGSYATGEADFLSDLDLMIIGEVNLSQFASIISELERELNRSINYVIFTKAEWEMKIANDDPFIRNVIKSPKVMLMGDERAL